MQTKEAVLTPKPQKQYKDRLFRLLFSERSDLLELYNSRPPSEPPPPEGHEPSSPLLTGEGKNAKIELLSGSSRFCNYFYITFLISSSVDLFTLSCYVPYFLL